MTLVESAANLLVGQFGVTVKVFPQDSQSPEDSNNPVFFEDTDNNSDFTEHEVRLYTSASDEMVEEYGLNDSADAIMYSTSDIASEGDYVEYDRYKWNVEEHMTNQIDSNGPYIHVYAMGAL